MVDLYNQDTNNNIWAGVVFTNDFTSGWPASISYKLRVALRTGSEDRDRWRTDRTYVFFATFGYRNNDSYGEEPCKFLFYVSRSVDKIHLSLQDE